MKILGLTYDNGIRMYMKPDSALLVGGKPFFLPPFAQQTAMYPCLVVRLCRLGRNIGERFASRYYDAVAMGMNLQATDLLATAKAEGMPWTEAVAFDGSLPVGGMMPAERLREDSKWVWMQNGTEVFAGTTASLICRIDEAVCRVSARVTVRMGDMLAVDMQTAACCLHQEDDFRGYADGEEMLHCRIK